MCFICQYSRRLLWIGKVNKQTATGLLVIPDQYFQSLLHEMRIWLARITDFPEGSCEIHIWCDCFRCERLALEHIKQNIMCNTFTFMHLADAFIQSDLQCIQAIHYCMRVPWELNPQPFALITQCSTTEPQEQNNRATLKTALLKSIYFAKVKAR